MSDTPPALSAYLAATAALSPLAAPVLRRRLKRGKEDPARWREKLGHASAPRPDGSLVWMHAVGLGEVMALRGLIERMTTRRPGLNILVTSTARSSGEVFARNRPEGAIHQFLPLDLPGPARRFLDHWRPDLAVWAEQDLWPGLVHRTHRRGIPLALVNARMDDRAFAARKRARAIYAPLLSHMRLVAAQDDRTAAHLAALGAASPRVTGSLKAVAPPLAHDAAELARLRTRLGGRTLWLAASTHAEDEAAALAAHARLRDSDPTALLILAPRIPDRAPDIAKAAASHGLTTARRSAKEDPAPGTAVWIADTFGELGLWYRLCPAALVGGSFGPVQGHNPWEPARLGCAILHGSNTANFAADYAALAAAQATREVTDAATLAAALQDPTLPDRAAAARTLAEQAGGRADALAEALLSRIPARHP